MPKKFYIASAFIRKVYKIPVSMFLGIIAYGCTQAEQKNPSPTQVVVPAQTQNAVKGSSQFEIKSEDIFHFNFDDKYLDQLFTSFPEIVTRLPEPKAEKNSLLKTNGGKIYINKGTFRNGVCSHYFATFHSSESLQGSEGLEFGILSLNTDQNRPLYIFTQGFGHGCNDAVEISPISRTFTLGSFSRMNNNGLKIIITESKNVTFEIIPK